MKTSRRNAIKGMAAGALLPMINIGCANFGLSRNRQIAKGAKIRVGLIGCGYQTHAMIDGVLCENLVAIVDPDPARIAWLDKYVEKTCGAAERANYASARRFSTYQDMFDKMGDELDAIVVETPNHQHVMHSIFPLHYDYVLSLLLKYLPLFPKVLHNNFYLFSIYLIFLAKVCKQ